MHYLTNMKIGKASNKSKMLFLISNLFYFLVLSKEIIIVKAELTSDVEQLDEHVFRSPMESCN